MEVYATIFAFEESPVTTGLLWAGSDDGLMHISRDTGKTWQDITPPGLPEFSTINVIALSPKDAGTAVISVYRYMLNDLTPFAYKTTDFGKTWKRIADGTNGIPVGHFIRVVRQDPDRPGLMFAGTEYGAASSAAIVTAPGVGNSSSAPIGAASLRSAGTRPLVAFSRLAA